jgi:hypothetical protein
MIRIDEIYYNIFVKSLQDRPTTGIHWFDPFGSTDFKDLIGPGYQFGDQQIVFWDQEPIHRHTISNFFKQYLEMYKPQYQGPIKLITSEKNSEDIAWACDTYNLTSGYYFFHAWAALDWYRGYNHTFLYKPFRDRQIEKTFLCPNNIIGGQRRHRLELLSELVDRELVYKNFISFPDRCPYEGKTVAELCLKYNIQMAAVDLPLKIDSGSNYANSSHCIDMWSLADQSLLHVVTETVYNGKKLHLTEKSFKPIVMQQPFILVSCQGSLEYLRSYGFKTFSDFWDESYDEADDATRILKIGKLLSDLDSLSTREKQQLQQALIPTVEHNFNWFYSHNFENLLWSELTTMIKSWL